MIFGLVHLMTPTEKVVDSPFIFHSNTEFTFRYVRLGITKHDHFKQKRDDSFLGCFVKEQFDRLFFCLKSEREGMRGAA